MKILHVSNHFWPCSGGIETYVRELCIEMNRLGHRNDVCCLDRCANSSDALKHSEELDGIKIFRIPFTDFGIYKFAPSVFRLLKDYDVVQIHGMGFFADFISVTKVFHKKPIMMNTHGGIFHTKSFSALKKIYFNIWCRLAFRGIDIILADGENDSKKFLSVAKNIVTVPIPVDYDRFSKIKRKPEKNTLVYIGRISKNKRVDNLIRAMKVVARKNPKAKLLIAGRDWEGLVPSLKALAEESGLSKNVSFLGEVSDKDLESLLSKATLYLFASEYEGGAVISVMEAMSAGVPVVVNSEIKDTCSGWLVEGKTGFYADYSVPESAGKKILDIMPSDLSKVSKSAKAEAKKCGWKSASSRMEEIYGCLA